VYGAYRSHIWPGALVGASEFAASAIVHSAVHNHSQRASPQDWVAELMIDRTAEFHAVVALRRQQQQGLRVPHAGAPPKTRSEFALASSSIGADIHSTAHKLEKLTQLAQSNTLLLFADPTEEINELTFIVKQDITALNRKLADLQAATRGRRDGGSKQQASHSTSIVEQLKNRLLESAKEFQDLLQTRKENVQLMQNRRDKLAAPSPAGSSSSRRDGGSASGDPAAGSRTPGGAAGTPPVFECGPSLGAPVLQVPSAAGGFGFEPGTRGGSIFECGVPLAAYNGGSVAAGGFGAGGFGAGGFGGGGGGLPAANDVVIEIPPQTLHQMQTQTLTLPSVNPMYLQSRAAAVDSVQTTIVELGNIFDQLSVRGTPWPRRCRAPRCRRRPSALAGAGGGAGRDGAARRRQCGGRAATDESWV